MRKFVQFRPPFVAAAALEYLVRGMPAARDRPSRGATPPMVFRDEDWSLPDGEEARNGAAARTVDPTPKAAGTVSPRAGHPSNLPGSEGQPGPRRFPDRGCGRVRAPWRKPRRSMSPMFRQYHALKQEHQNARSCCSGWATSTRCSTRTRRRPVAPPGPDPHGPRQGHRQRRPDVWLSAPSAGRATPRSWFGRTCSVAICEQVEDPKKVKGLVQAERSSVASLRARSTTPAELDASVTTNGSRRRRAPRAGVGASR